MAPCTFRLGRFRNPHHTHPRAYTAPGAQLPDTCPEAAESGNLGERGLTLSRSQQQGCSTAYRTLSHIKVVCKGFDSRAPKLQYAKHRRQPSVTTGPSPAGTRGRSLFSYLVHAGASPRSGTDSNLEAFSYYPADGSFAALPGRTAAKTNYLNERFLSYLAQLPLRRVHQ